MDADVKGALASINTSWKAFVHHGQPMTKKGVKLALEYALSKGYTHTGQMSEAEVDAALTPGTTPEQWERYYVEAAAHDKRMEETKPVREKFSDQGSFDRAFSAWLMESSCNAPNKPGYFRANND